MQLATLSQPAGSYLTTAWNTLLFSRIFWILHAVANPLFQGSKRNLIPLRAKTKGANKFIKKCNISDTCAFYMKQSSVERCKHVRSQATTVYFRLGKLRQVSTYVQHV
jgi:hypothetical protein